ncbi:MAG: type VI secretion system protein TssA, partial [Acidobacteriota bacterium]
TGSFLMSEELQQPAVVDLDALLQPIPGENPSGESLRYASVYDEVNEARRQDEVLDQGAWQTELKMADFRRVIELVVPAVTSQSKDLQLSVWLTEALAKQHGFVGFRDGVKLLVGLQEQFWDTLFPEIDEGDMEGRANAIGWLDVQGVLVLKNLSFTGGLGYNYLNWEDSRRFDIPDNIESLPFEEMERARALAQLAEKERRVTLELWQKEMTQTRRAAMEQFSFNIDECKVALADLNRVVEEKFDRNQAPSLGSCIRALDEINTQVKKILEEKRLEEPDPVDEVAGEEVVGEDGVVRVSGGGGGPIQSRKDALKRLAETATYFQKNEPHSPVAYLVQRAVKWGNMPLEVWLQDVIKDDNIIGQVRQTLGFNTGEESPSE